MFAINWTRRAGEEYRQIKAAALAREASRKEKGIKKSSKQEGLYRQARKTVELLRQNPRHPGLQTHKYHSLPNPYAPHGAVFVAYVQIRTAAAYRIFWCYGPGKGELTIIAITRHP